MLIPHCVLIPDTGEPGVARLPAIRLQLFLTTIVCKEPGEFPQTSAWTRPLHHERFPVFRRGRSLISSGGRKKEIKEDGKMETSAGTSSKFISGRDSEPSKTGWHLKLGPRMGGGSTKGVVTGRRGISKLPRFFSPVWKIKEGKKSDYFAPRISEPSGTEWRRCLGTICPAIIPIHYGWKMQATLRGWRCITEMKRGLSSESLPADVSQRSTLSSIQGSPVLIWPHSVTCRKRPQSHKFGVDVLLTHRRNLFCTHFVKTLLSKLYLLNV